MAVDRAAVVAIAPELDAVPADDARWDAFLADADLFCGARTLGSAKADAAKKYLVAHWLTASVQGVASEAAETGPLKSVTIGPVTKVFDTASSNGTVTADNLASSRYGAMYLKLIRVAAIGVY